MQLKLKYLTLPTLALALAACQGESASGTKETVVGNGHPTYPYQVVVGTVESIAPLAGSESPFVSEHMPIWKVAQVRVESVIHGFVETSTVAVRFQDSHDIAWFAWPKLAEGQRAEIVLHDDTKTGNPTPGLLIDSGDDVRPVDVSPSEAHELLDYLAAKQGGDAITNERQAFAAANLTLISRTKAQVLSATPHVGALTAPAATMHATFLFGNVEEQRAQTLSVVYDDTRIISAHALNGRNVDLAAAQETLTRLTAAGGDHATDLRAAQVSLTNRHFTAEWANLYEQADAAGVFQLDVDFKTEDRRESHVIATYGTPAAGVAGLLGLVRTGERR